MLFGIPKVCPPDDTPPTDTGLVVDPDASTSPHAYFEKTATPSADCKGEDGLCINNCPTDTSATVAAALPGPLKPLLPSRHVFSESYSKLPNSVFTHRTVSSCDLTVFSPPSSLLSTYSLSRWMQRG